MGIVSQAIEVAAGRAVEKAFDRYFRSPEFEAILDKAFHNSAAVKFIKAMQMEMLRIDPSMDVMEAWEAAKAAGRNFMADEKIKFGDPRYAWDRSAALDLIHEMEITHWESRS
jgi:hypothetical protein